MADQAVEIHGRRQADVAGVIGHFGHVGEVCLKIADRRIGSFQGRAFVEIQYQEQLIFVVEGQHFQRHVAHGSQAHRRNGQDRNDGKEQPGQRAKLQ